METRKPIPTATIFMPNAQYTIYEVCSTAEMTKVTDILGRYIWPNTPDNWDAVDKLLELPDNIVEKAMSDINTILFSKSIADPIGLSHCFWALFFDPSSIASVFISNKRADIWYDAYTCEPYTKYINYRFIQG